MTKKIELSYEVIECSRKRLIIHHNDFATNMIARLVERAVYFNSPKFDFKAIWNNYEKGIVPMLSLNIAGWNHYNIGLYFFSFNNKNSFGPINLADVVGDKNAEGDYMLSITLAEQEALDNIMPEGGFCKYLINNINEFSELLRRKRMKLEERTLDRENFNHEIQAQSIPHHLSPEMTDKEYYISVYEKLDELDRMNFGYLTDDLREKL